MNLQQEACGSTILITETLLTAAVVARVGMTMIPMLKKILSNL